jgi:hypothetical protein
MVAPVQQIYRYSVDAADVIDFVDRWWLAFATENGGAGLEEASVVGHTIWEFIADAPSRKLYREIHEHVRKTGRAIEVPFRCDSPALRRYMQLTIRRQGQGRLLYESRVIRTAPQRCLAVLDRSTKRSSSFLTMCSFCKRSLIEPSGWLEMEDIALRLKMDDQATVPELRYTVCPECLSKFRNRGAAEST